jgi:hypothetical protein
MNCSYSHLILILFYLNVLSQIFLSGIPTIKCFAESQSVTNKKNWQKVIMLQKLFLF